MTSPRHGFYIREQVIVTTPSTVDEERTEDQTQDPTWEPSRQQEGQMTPEGIEDRYWLRSRVRDRQGEPPAIVDETSTDMVNNEVDAETVGTEPSANIPPEAGDDTGQGEQIESTRRYNLRPLPGRKI
jgi:hypothetical protein